ncbi:large ribosomal subunit protein eL29-like [Glossophaga mutica]
MCFAKKHNKKSLNKRQANNTKAMSECAEGIKALVKPKITKGSTCKFSQLAYIAHPKLRKYACACITKGLQLCLTKAKAKAQTKPQAADAAAAQAPAQAQFQPPKGAQTPVKAP